MIVYLLLCIISSLLVLVYIFTILKANSKGT